MEDERLSHHFMMSDMLKQDENIARRQLQTDRMIILHKSETGIVRNADAKHSDILLVNQV